MKKENYSRYEVQNIILKAIEAEHKNSKAFIAWNPGKNAEERKKVEEYTCSALSALLSEF